MPVSSTHCRAGDYTSKVRLVSCPWPAGYPQSTDTEASVDPKTGGDSGTRKRGPGTNWLPGEDAA